MMTICWILPDDAPCRIRLTPGSPGDEASRPPPPHAQRITDTAIAREKFGNEMQRTEIVLAKSERSAVFLRHSPASCVNALALLDKNRRLKGDLRALRAPILRKTAIAR